MQKRWNILIFPNTSDTGFNISVSERAMKLGASFALIFLVAATALCAVTLNSWKAEHISQVNKLEGEVQARELDLAGLEKNFQNLLSIEDKLRTIAGLKPRRMAVGEAGKGGKGGPESSELIPYPYSSNRDIPYIPSYSFSGDKNTSPEAFLEALAAAYDGLSEIMEAFEKEQKRLSSIPSINPVYSRDAWISSGYGYRTDPINREKKFHDGADIVAPRKSPIIATAAGVVKFAGWRTGLGRTVEIRHGYGYTTIFAHNEKLTVKKGDRVKRGDVIAYLGSSGRSTGPHLHYEVRLNGRTRNPYKYVID